jgi:hypothetical protein
MQGPALGPVRRAESETVSDFVGWEAAWRHVIALAGRDAECVEVGASWSIGVRFDNEAARRGMIRADWFKAGDVMTRKGHPS